MKYTHTKLVQIITLPWLLLFGTGACADNPQPLQVPEGFRIDTLNFSVPNARQMALTENGTLIVGTRRAGNVYAIPGALEEPAPEVITLLDGLPMPSGVTVRDGDLYIGALNRIIKVPDVQNNLHVDPPSVEITNALPDKSHHGWKYIKFGPDGALYVPVGAPCNVCLSEDERFATLLRMDVSDGSTEVWAHGIRNTVGFAWHPADGRLWFSDNGRDMMGDDIPPEEINVINRPGEHFGYPFIHANGIADPEFGDHPAAQDKQFTPPVLEIQAHSAALGMAFYDHTQFGDAYQNALFVAEHGSWNRSSKVGYLVSVVRAAADGTLEYEHFATGWLVGEDDWGRPNDVLVAPDGSLLISDDKQGVIYQVSRLSR